MADRSTRRFIYTLGTRSFINRMESSPPAEKEGKRERERVGEYKTYIHTFEMQNSSQRNLDTRNDRGFGEKSRAHAPEPYRLPINSA